MSDETKPAWREQNIIEAISDLVTDYPGVIVSVDQSPNMAVIRLHRKGTDWTVCIARAEPRPDVVSVARVGTSDPVEVEQ